MESPGCILPAALLARSIIASGGFEEDRRVLEAKINEAYVSKDHFEVLVQAMDAWRKPKLLSGTSCTA